MHESREALRLEREAAKARYIRDLKFSRATLAVATVTAVILAVIAFRNAGRAVGDKDRAQKEEGLAKASEKKAIKYAKRGLRAAWCRMHGATWRRTPI